MRKVCIAVILIFALAVTLGLMLFDLISGDPLNVPATIRAILLAVIAAFILGRISSGKGSGRKDLAGYKKLYEGQLRAAFRDRPKKQAVLLEAIHQFQIRAYAKSEAQLLELLPDCRSKEEYSAVKLFLGAACSKQEKYQDAVKWYQSLLEREPDYSIAWSNLGNAYRKLAQPQEAKLAFEQAVACDQSNSYAYSNLAELYLQQGQPEQALEWGKRALAYDNTYLYAMKLVAAAASVLSDSAQAEAYSRMFLEAGGSSGELQRSIAQFGASSESLKEMLDK